MDANAILLVWPRNIYAQTNKIIFENHNRQVTIIYAISDYRLYIELIYIKRSLNLASYSTVRYQSTHNSDSWNPSFTRAMD